MATLHTGGIDAVLVAGGAGAGGIAATTGPTLLTNADLAGGCAIAVLTTARHTDLAGGLTHGFGRTIGILRAGDIGALLILARLRGITVGINDTADTTACRDVAL